MTFDLSVPPSVSPNRFPGIIWRSQQQNGLKFGSLVYPDHLQSYVDFGFGILIFFILGAILI